MKSVKLAVFVLLMLVSAPVCWSGQDSNADLNAQAQSVSDSTQLVARSTKAIAYRQGSKSEISFQGTELMPQAKGKATVETKSGTTQIKAELQGLGIANTFGLEYLTYVLWAISPDGIPSNLGELIPHDGKAELHASVPMQAFALIVTAEPYFAVTQPSVKIVAEGVPGQKAQGSIRSVDVKYQAVPANLYSSHVQPIEEPVYGIDKDVPLSLKEARNAVRIAKIAGADQYAASPLERGQQLLDQADDYYRRKQNDKAIATAAREATQAAEVARVSALKAEQQAKLDEEKRAATENAARAQAEAENQARQAQAAQAQSNAQAQQAQQAEASRQAAEQQAAQAQAAAQQATAAAQAAQQQVQQQATSGQQVQAQQQAAAQQAQTQAEQARQEAAASQQRAQDQERLAQQAEQQLHQQQAATQQTQQQLEQTQQQVQQAQTEKEQVRQRLLSQLNQVLQTKDSARGLIVNMPDVLFDLNSASLKPEARERLARVGGILIAYPDIHVEVDGYTDNTGSLDFNQQLSQQRADTVRSYLVQQGVPSSSVNAMGFGPNDPIASNDSPEGRRQNRRVNLIVSGKSIGVQAIPGSIQ